MACSRGSAARDIGATDKELATMKGHTSAVTSVSLSPDGRTLASGSADRTIRLWDVNSGTKKDKKDRTQ
jgi:WD40 repeat protein